ncbi:hypothetical protein F2Q69_00026050 [Brassica cretica]|uniref:Rad60/SUMO-like domain-containing protein n=1 Tax=Brassica cretica TaxID=69181 RepID=A0A8S9S1M9_BRACR|nr:hypothetical protein F2Q69_00026050 [Brassica cretica]
MSATQEEDTKHRLGGAHINLKVKGQDGNKVFYRINSSTQLKKLMDAYDFREHKQCKQIKMFSIISKPHAPQKNKFHATSPPLATDSPQQKRSNKFMYEEKHCIGMSRYNSYSIVAANWEVKSVNFSEI